MTINLVIIALYNVMLFSTTPIPSTLHLHSPPLMHMHMLCTHKPAMLCTHIHGCNYAHTHKPANLHPIHSTQLYHCHTLLAHAFSLCLLKSHDVCCPELLHYPLEKIVEEFVADDTEITSWIEDYIQNLKSYRVSTKLFDYISAAESDSTVDEPEEQEHINQQGMTRSITKNSQSSSK